MPSFDEVYTVHAPFVWRILRTFGVGDAQIEVLFNAYRQATSGLPTVDADFLLKRSGPANTQE